MKIITHFKCSIFYHRFIWITLLIILGIAVVPSSFSQNLQVTPNDIGFQLSLEGQSFSKAVNIFLLITVLSLVPSFIMMMTSFTRIVIVLALLKQALGMHQAPSNKTVGALALFLTFFIMQPVWDRIYNDAIQPYSKQQINQEQAIEIGIIPLKEFMLRQARESSLLLFMDLGNMDPVASPAELSMTVIIPAFMLSELKTAFQMGFLLYLPFLVVDIVVATVLMSMGMMMLPPMMISLPFKLLLFIIIDGWGILIKTLVSSFY